MQIRIKATFFVHSTKVKPPTSCLWLVADRGYSVMASGGASSNQMGVTESSRHVSVILYNSGIPFQNTPKS